MDINAAFPSKYVKSAEIPEEGVSMLIDRVDVEDVDGKGTRKLVVYFAKAKKGFVLNITNAKKIANLIGAADTDQWPGHTVTLYRSETEYAGETVDCIRVRAAKNGKAPVEKPKPLATELDDSEIPF
jgi:hypothetical protein